jgi:hypothetical protein
MLYRIAEPYQLTYLSRCIGEYQYEQVCNIIEEGTYYTINVDPKPFQLELYIIYGVTNKRRIR